MKGLIRWSLVGAGLGALLYKLFDKFAGQHTPVTLVASSPILRSVSPSAVASGESVVTIRILGPFTALPPNYEIGVLGIPPQESSVDRVITLNLSSYFTVGSLSLMGSDLVTTVKRNTKKLPDSWKIRPTLLIAARIYHANGDTQFGFVTLTLDE